MSVANAKLGLGRYREADQALRRALVLREAAKMSAADLGEVRYLLARSLYPDATTRKEAIASLRAARRELETQKRERVLVELRVRHKEWRLPRLR